MSIHELKTLRPGFTRVDWRVLATILLLHGLLVSVPFTFSWGALVSFLLLHWLTTSIGVSLYFHRTLTHRALRLPRILEAPLAVCGCLALQYDVITWVAIHRKHHAHSDQDGDPHSPRPSFWWGYLGWMVLPDDAAQPDAIARRYAPDLIADPFYRFFQRTYLIYPLLLGIGLYGLGGWSYVLWGVVLRVVVVWHLAWLTNTATHRWGYRRYPTRDDSTNLWWLAYTTYGEGWHNNHHGEPRSANFGRRGWELDPTWAVIRLLEMLHLAQDVHRPRKAPPVCDETTKRTASIGRGAS